MSPTSISSGDGRGLRNRDRTLEFIHQTGKLSLSSYGGAGPWATLDDSALADKLEDDLRTLDQAVAFGAPDVQVAIGALTPGPAELRLARQRAQIGLRQLAPHAAERGLNLVLEPIHPLFCPDVSVLCTLRQSLDWTDGIGATNLGLVLDVHHMFWDPELDDQLSRAGDRLRIVHLNDWPLPRGERYDRALMGEGCIDFAELFQSLRQFTGWFEVEVNNDELRSLPLADVFTRVAASFDRAVAPHLHESANGEAYGFGMKLRKLGRTELMVSQLCLGGNVFGWTADEAASFEVLDAYAEAGGNYVDTCSTYSRWAPGNQGGESETIIGNWMKSRGNRARMLIATKGFGMTGSTCTRRGLTRVNLTRSLEGSLRRLQTDYVDMYLSHYDDRNTPQEETMETYDRFVREGKVRYVGVGAGGGYLHTGLPEGPRWQFTALRLLRALWVSDKHGWTPYAMMQPEYNLFTRVMFEPDLPDELAQDQGLGVITRSSLASGFLTGQVSPWQQRIGIAAVERSGAPVLQRSRLCDPGRAGSRRGALLRERGPDRAGLDHGATRDRGAARQRQHSFPAERHRAGGRYPAGRRVGRGARSGQCHATRALANARWRSGASGYRPERLRRRPRRG